jgi:hypothetical protein
VKGAMVWSGTISVFCGATVIRFCLFVDLYAFDSVSHCTMAQALNKFEIKDFAKMIPSAPIFPLSLSNSLSFALNSFSKN